eukprot:TRINITY_DN2431_c0_g1_i11.p3 TRINITY_DN2431_c0_g1~~TRINITY_DN2431_c0_g1_i11.p3  ORF type:complete len:271 (-),score=27.97 TRINITY_DN2431_c0_g1_i11:329-1141(-)
MVVLTDFITKFSNSKQLQLLVLGGSYLLKQCFTFASDCGMSWRSHGVSNADLVDSLKRNGVIKSDAVAEAMRAVDRGLFVKSRDGSYSDCPMNIGHGATISAPHMHAYALEYLKDYLFPGAKVLDIGSGSGYLTAVFAYMVAMNDSNGRAIGVEHIPALAQWSKRNIERIGWAKEMMVNKIIQIHEGDGRLGYPSEGPYDAIHVGAAAVQVPQALKDQLKPGGRMIIPVGVQLGMQSLQIIDKQLNGKLVVQDTMAVIYVPLTSRQNQEF